jgi:hypothetical protein
MERMAAIRGPASWLPKWIQFLRLCKSLHNRNYEQLGIRQSLTRAKRDLRRWALDMADDAAPPVFA